MRRPSIILLVVGLVAVLSGSSQAIRVPFGRSRPMLMHNFWNPWRESSLWRHQDPFFDPFWHSDFDALIDQLQWHSPYLLDNTGTNCERPPVREQPVQNHVGCDQRKYVSNEAENAALNGVNQEENSGSANRFKEQSGLRFRPENNRATPQQRQHPAPQQRMPTTNLQARPVAFAELDVAGYRSDELDIWTEGNKVVVKGHHKCDCDDSCLVTEFQRTYAVPRGIDSKSVKAKYGRDGKLVLQGLPTRSQQHHQISQDRQVELDYQGPKETPRENIQCQRKAAGIPLKKVKVPKRDLERETVYDEPANRRDTFEGEVADDGVTIEVVE